MMSDWGRKDIHEGSDVRPGGLCWGRVVLSDDYWALPLNLHVKEWYVSIGRYFVVFARYVDPVTGERRTWIRRGQWSS